MAKLKKQKGISIVYIILITSFIFAISIGVNSISYQQAKTMNQIGLSTVAFYAADSGAERQLYNLYKESTILPNINFTFDSSFAAQASTSVTCASNDPAYCLDPSILYTAACDSVADNFCVKSVGDYKGTKRAIELTY